MCRARRTSRQMVMIALARDIQKSMTSARRSVRPQRGWHIYYRDADLGLGAILSVTTPWPPPNT